MPTANSPAIQTALCTAPPLLGTLDTPLALGTSGSAVATLSGFILSPAFPQPGALIGETVLNRPPFRVRHKARSFVSFVAFVGATHVSPQPGRLLLPQEAQI